MESHPIKDQRHFSRKREDGTASCPMGARATVLYGLDYESQLRVTTHRTGLGGTQRNAGEIGRQVGRLGFWARCVFHMHAPSMVNDQTMEHTLLVRSYTGADEARAWEQFVASHSEATNYHRWGWKQVIENSFGWPTYYLVAEEGGRVRGILPLVWQRSRLFGSFLISLPYLNAGGIVAEIPEAGQALLDHAVHLTQQLEADHLELRHRGDHQLDLPTKFTKVRAVKIVNPDEEKMFQELHKKVRADVRRSQKSGFIAEFGHEEFLDDFYSVFATNMRDLGTPIYSRRFFREIFCAFPRETYICRVRLGRAVVAASLLTAHGDCIEVAWSSSVRKYLPLKPNMFLYWNLICFAGTHNYRIFDFGRSTLGAGTHKFKMQWGAQELPLYWNYWLPSGGTTLPEVNPQNPKYRLAIHMWQKLPVWLTRWIGPRIGRCLP